MTLSDLQFCRKLLDQGVPLEKATVRRVVDHAIELALREPLRHDEQCQTWAGQACDCPESYPREYRHDR
jgi:hypothetical protein